MRFLELTKRNLKEAWRDPAAMGLLLGFPLFFMILMGAAFGKETTPTFPVGVIDQDKTEISKTFIDKALSKVSALEISSYDESPQALEDLKIGNLRAYITIPPGFSEQISQNWRRKNSVLSKAEGTNIILNITYDESDPMVAEQVISIVNSALRSFAKIEIPITLNKNPIHIETEITYIDFIAPGIIIFGLLILIPTSAAIIIRDKEKGFLARLLTTPVRSWEFILSYSLCLISIAILQIIIFLIVACLFGLDIVGSPFLAFLIFFLTSLCSIGIGMVIASLAKNEKQADSLSWLISMPLAMLSGCWFTTEFMPQWMQNVAYAFPFAHAIDASRSILIRGTGFGAIATDFLFLIIWAVIVFSIGIILFQRKMTYK